MPERWRPIPGHKGYEASSLGRVRSTERTLRDGRTAGGVILAQQEDRDGYRKVKLGGRTVPVHTAVLLAFQGRPEGRHLDGNRTNNAPENLAWGSHLMNERDKRRKGNIDTKDVIGTGSRPENIVSSPVTPGTSLVTLSEAVAAGIVSCSLQALRIARHRGRLPEPVGLRGTAQEYDPVALALWDAQRGGRAG
jgi:hypothetical protein